MRTRIVPIVAVVVWLLADRGARAETARVVVIGDGITLNRILPAGESVTLELSVPGADDISGVLKVWPTDQSTCGDNTRPFGDKQFHALGMSVSGTNDNRLLTAVIPPLQIQTSYCIQLEVQRGLREDQVNAIADGIGDRAAERFDWDTRCADADIGEAVVAMIEQEITARLGMLVRDSAALGMTTAARPQTTPTTSAGVRAASELVVALAGIRTLCRELNDRRDALAAARRISQAADQAMAAATSELKQLASLKSTVLAWPVAIREPGPPFTATPLIDALVAPAPVISTVASHIEPFDRRLATDLRKLTTLAGDPLAQEIRTLQARLQVAPATPVPLMLFVPAAAAFLRADQLASDPQLYAQLVEAIVSRYELVHNQLRLIEIQSARNEEVMGRWRRAVAKVLETNLAASQRRADVDAQTKARADVIPRIRGALVNATRQDSVRRLLRNTTTLASPLKSTKPSAMTDERASWISPTIGIAVAVPYIREASGFSGSDTWIVPYAGVNLYFQRVDRVIDPGDLVGSRFWQNNSLTFGFWLQKPKVNAAAITGVWEAGPVPFVGFGHRFTPYIRVDAGAAFFEHASRLPTRGDTVFGFASWIGASLDADLWAVVSGKLGR